MKAKEHKQLLLKAIYFRAFENINIWEHEYSENIQNPKPKSFDCTKFRKKLEGHTRLKLERLHATGKHELTEVLLCTSYPSRKGEEPYTLLNLQQSSEENRKVICVSNQYRLTSYCVPPPELMKNKNQCLNYTIPCSLLLCYLCILRVCALIVTYFGVMTMWKTRKLLLLGEFNTSAAHKMTSVV